MCGCRVRVELSTGEKRSRSRGPPPSWSRRPRDDYRRRSPPVRRRYAFVGFQICILLFYLQAHMHFKGTEKEMLCLPHTAGIFVILQRTDYFWKCTFRIYLLIGKYYLCLSDLKPIDTFLKLIARPSGRSFSFTATVALSRNSVYLLLWNMWDKWLNLDIRISLEQVILGTFFLF